LRVYNTLQNSTSIALPADAVREDIGTANIKLKQPIAKWQTELTKAANKYHVIGCWVAIVFNTLFSLNDYLVIPEEWFRFFVFRIVVSSVIFLALMLWKRYKYSTEWLVFIPFSLICIENAYIWSFMDVVNFRTHTLAYIAIYIGASMIVIWRYQFSLLVVAISVIANVVFLKTYSQLGLDEIMINGALLVASVSIFSVVLLYTRYNLTKKELIARLDLQASKEILNEQKIIIEDNHRDITDSIRYAEKIQHSMLPAISDIQEHLPQSFVLFEPKDIVSGDFYWFAYRDGKSIIAAVDCTGHGVPGALMSMLGNAMLNRIVNELGITEPTTILNELRSSVINTMKKNGTEQASGGMDMALCTIHHAEKKVQFAGAFNPLYQVRAGTLVQHNANRMPIGRYEGFEVNPFNQETIESKPGDWFYIFSDGFADQFGGPENRKLGSRRFKELLTEISVSSATRQKEKLSNFHRIWKDGQPQIDDVVVIGFQL
jgi:phosphoserine phosphatase RsbU/P